MKGKKPSIKDIAQQLNISITTVSFVLNGKGKEKKISDETIKRVLDYIEEIDYKPNLIARSLRTGQSKFLVFMVEDISNNFFSKIAKIVEGIAHKKGYKVLFCSNENSDTLSNELIDLFQDRQVDGFLITPSAGIEKDIEKLIKTGVPVVLFDRYFESLDSNYVVLDNYDAAHKATTHLIDNDFKKTVLVTIDVEQSQMKDRQRGYEKAMREKGLKSQVVKVPFENDIAANSKNTLKLFLESDAPYDSLLFSTNYLTQYGLELLSESDPNLIKNLGIITFDDSDFFRILSPKITCMDQPLEKMGEELMRVMFSLLKKDGKSIQNVHATYNATLIERCSAKALSRRC